LYEYLLNQQIGPACDTQVVCSTDICSWKFRLQS